MRGLEQDAPGLILLDVNLPGTNGFAFCQQVRAKAATPIIFTPGRTGDDDQIPALSVGSTTTSPKPSR